MMRTKDYYYQRATEIITGIQYATLATVTPEGDPWNSPVRAVHDQNGCFYWFSDKDNQHSRNVRHAGKVFIVIYDSTVPEGQGEGVYMQAHAVQLEEGDVEEIRRARRLKKGPGDEDPAQFLGKSARRVYKATPEAIWMNDAEMRDGVFIRDYRTALSLDVLQHRLSRRSR